MRRLPLTVRQRQCALLRALGFHYAEIAQELELKPRRVEEILFAVRRKMGIQRGTQRENLEELVLRVEGR